MRAFRLGYRTGAAGDEFPVSAPNLVPMYAGWMIGHGEREVRNNRRAAKSKAART